MLKLIKQQVAKNVNGSGVEGQLAENRKMPAPPFAAAHKKMGNLINEG